MSNSISYFSSNRAIFGSRDLEARIRNSSLPTVGLAQAIIEGQAPDGGLYMPTHIPQIDMNKIMRMKGEPYSRFFVETMKDFFEGVLSEKTLDRIAQEAYTFEPYIEWTSKVDVIARLDEGPTAAFKDYAAQVFFRVIDALIKEEPKTEIEFRQHLKDIELLTFIVATSGDTGSAMGVACHKMPKMLMFILHSSYIPQHISDLQAKQMDTLGDNVYVCRIPADFNRCAKIASQLLSDSNLGYMKRNSANSVNMGRLLPQMVYYPYIYSRVAEDGEEMIFSVPCGNFGDLVGGISAMRRGLPIRFIVGVNENDVFERFYRTGIYAPAKETKPSPSNAMNVRDPSNMRRLVQFYGGQLIDSVVTVNPNFRKLKGEIVAVYSILDEESHEMVKVFYEEKHVIDNLHSIIEDHTGVAEAAARRFRKETGYGGKIARISTAHSGKFPESLNRFGMHPKLPNNLAVLVDKPHGNFFVVPDDYGIVKSVLEYSYNQELSRNKQRN